jgi:hypothetical protein
LSQTKKDFIFPQHRRKFVLSSVAGTPHAERRNPAQGVASRLNTRQVGKQLFGAKPSRKFTLVSITIVGGL